MRKYNKKYRLFLFLQGVRASLMHQRWGLL